MPFEVGDSHYLTMSEVAADLGIPTSTLKSLIRRGVLPDVPKVRYVTRDQRGFPDSYAEMARAKLRESGETV